MTVVDRAALRNGLRGWVAGTAELSRLQDAMRVLFPGRRRPSVTALAEALLLSAVRRHEGATRGQLGRLNESLSRLMDDVDALSRGRSVEGRTATMRTEDLQTVERALADLSRLEDRVRHALATDESGSWTDQLRIELETALQGGGTARGSGVSPPRPRGLPRAPGTVAALADLRAVIDRLGGPSQGLWHGRRLPRALGDAAQHLVVAAGGDIAAAVRRALTDGGAHADAMVVAILWKRGVIAPGTATGATKAWHVHQRNVSGLDFEWTGRFPVGESYSSTVGIDHIAGGLLVDAKHSDVPLEARPELTQVPEPRTTWAERTDVQPDVGAQLRAGERTRSLAAEERAWGEARHKYLMQMRRQLAFARANGLCGFQWVCNTEELADAFRLLSFEIPAGERAGLHLDFRVGGTP